MRAVIGALSGMAATGPMTVLMILLHRRLPFSERYPLPPRQITMKLARAAGIGERLLAEERYSATLVAHFAYGAATGALYGAVEPAIKAPYAAKGLLFGMIVWSGSYLGLLPIAKVLRPASEHPARRNLLMIAAHAVWGLSLAWLSHIFLTEAATPGPNPLSGSGSQNKDVQA